MKRIPFALFGIGLLVSILAAQKKADLQPAGLNAGTYRYAVSFKMREIPMLLNMAVVIKETAGEWTVAETTTAELAGEISDVGVYDKKSLMLLARSFRQGPALIDLAYKQNRIKGQTVVDGRSMPFDVEVGGPLFGDGPAFIFSIGILPLEKGYSNSFRSFDMKTHKADRVHLMVAELENVTVPAGSFDSYRVEISSANSRADDYTVWVAKSSRKPVKMIADLPEMSGAKLTAELQ